MTTRYDVEYTLPNDVMGEAECEVYRTNTVYYDAPISVDEVNAWLTYARQRSRAYRVVNEYHRKARKARAQYAREWRKY